jgi:hypothetical protein
MQEAIGALGVAMEDSVVVVPHGNVFVGARVVFRPKRRQIVRTRKDGSDGAVSLARVSISVDSDDVVGDLAIALFVDSVEQDEQQVETGQERILKNPR